jgi:hypothetical protein
MLAYFGVRDLRLFNPMRASAIQTLSASNVSAKVAAAFFENTVQVWDLSTREKVAEFETVFSSGGNRLALDDAGRKCVAAAWNKGNAEASSATKLIPES